MQADRRPNASRTVKRSRTDHAMQVESTREISTFLIAHQMLRSSRATAIAGQVLALNASTCLIPVIRCAVAGARDAGRPTPRSPPAADYSR